MGGTLAGSSTCGYFLWCPDYSCTQNKAYGSYSDQANVFVWQNASPAAIPLNNDAFPYGSAQDPIVDGVFTAYNRPDPAGPLVASGTVADARVLSACLQMTYYGTMTESAGEVGFVNGLPLEELLTGGPSNGPFSVNQLMTFVNNKTRLGVDTLECIYRPNELSSEHFRSRTDSPLILGPGGGATVVETVLDESARALSPRVFGFVWRNTQPDAGLTFDMTKSLEWRPDTTVGLTQVPIVSYGPSRVPAVTRALDAHERRTGRPIWNRIMGAMKSVAGQISQLALSGTGQKAIRWGEGQLMQAGQRYLGAMAPLMLM